MNDDNDMTKFIYATMADVPFKISDQEELALLRKTKPILRDEILTCYQFIKENGLWKKFEDYRG